MYLKHGMIALTLTALAACGGSTNKNFASNGQSVSGPTRAMFITPVAERAGSAQRFVTMRVTPFAAAGGGYDRIQVELRGGNAATGRRGLPVINTDLSTATRAGASLSTAVDDGTPYAIAAQAVAASGYCPSGRLSPYAGITRYSNPNDINAIVNASRANGGRDTVPAGVSGSSVSSTSFSTSGGPHWRVNLRCS